MSKRVEEFLRTMADHADNEFCLAAMLRVRSARDQEAELDAVLVEIGEMLDKLARTMDLFTDQLLAFLAVDSG
ncbi:MAG: hypothetical protein KJ056_10550 [Acidimicrobiia bacterium]|nr:hypothetical protein [Acidimicrobiia bacterium]